MPTLVQHPVPLHVRRPVADRAAYRPLVPSAHRDAPLRLAPNGLRMTVPDAEGRIRFVRCELETEAALDRLPFLWGAADSAGLRTWMAALAVLACGAVQSGEPRFWPATIVAVVLLGCSAWSLVRAERSLGRAVRDARRRLAAEGCSDAEAAWLVRPLGAGTLPEPGPLSASVAPTLVMSLSA